MHTRERKGGVGLRVGGNGTHCYRARPRGCLLRTLQEKGGSIDIKMAPKAVSAREETELQAMMDRLAAENEEQDGDGPDEDES